MNWSRQAEVMDPLSASTASSVVSWLPRPESAFVVLVTKNNKRKRIKIGDREDGSGWTCEVALTQGRQLLYRGSHLPAPTTTWTAACWGGCCDHGARRRCGCISTVTASTRRRWGGEGCGFSVVEETKRLSQCFHHMRDQSVRLEKKNGQERSIKRFHGNKGERERRDNIGRDKLTGCRSSRALKWSRLWRISLRALAWSFNVHSPRQSREKISLSHVVVKNYRL